MANTALNRTGQLLLTNKSGGAVAQGDIVIVDTANAASFTTTTTSGYVSGTPGVVLEPGGIANNATGMIAVQGYVPIINLSGTGSIGDLIKTHSVAKQGVRNAAPVVTGNFAQALGTSATPVAILWGTVNVNTAVAAGSDGWTAGTGTWSYSSADAPTFVISVNADMTAILGVGMKIKLTQTTVKYFIVTAVGSFSGGATLITVYGGTDYVLANAAISSPNYSVVKAPLGFPMSPAKWSVIVTDSTIRTQASPTKNTWYNLGTTACQITVPIGTWYGEYKVGLYAYRNATAATFAVATLSTANNSESDANWTQGGYSSNGSVNSTFDLHENLHVSGIISVATKTTLYLNACWDKGLVMNADGTSMSFRNDIMPMVLSLTCAYL